MSDWYFEREGRKLGPFSLLDLRSLAGAGLVGPETTVWDFEGRQFAASDVLEFKPQRADESPGRHVAPSSAGTERDSAAIRTSPSDGCRILDERTLTGSSTMGKADHRFDRTAWNPATIAWFGILFTPVWCGVMAAINARRLRVASPIWRPIAIGIGGLLGLEFLTSFFDSWLVEIAAYLGIVFWLWKSDLEPQSAAFEARSMQRTSASWLFPVLAGSPGAVVAVLGLVIAPLIPPTPQEVCQQFLNAASMKHAKTLTTTNLWPALDTLAGLPGDLEEQAGHFEITAEEPAAASLGGHLVAYRMLTEKRTGNETMEGIFHLVDRGGSWKIEDIYYTSFNGEALAEPARLSQTYRNLIQGSGNGKSVAAQNPHRTTGRTHSGPVVSRGAAVMIGRALFTGLLASPAVKKLGLLIAAGFAAIVALGRKKK